HLDELPPRQRQNLTDGRARVFLNREISRLRRDVELGVRPSDLTQGAWDHDQVRVLFDQLAFRTLWPRLLEAVGEAAAEPATTDFEVEVDVARDAQAAVALLEAVVDAGEPYALEPRWEGAPGASSLRALALARGDGRVAYVDHELLGDAAVRS